MPRTYSKTKRKAVCEFIRSFATEIEEFIEKRFNLKPKPRLIVTFDPKYKRSLGGGPKPLILISMYQVDISEEFIEYLHIEHDSEIGEVKCANWQHHAACLLVHEYAHVLDDKHRIRAPRNAKYYKDDGKKISAGHGKRWQYIYRILRRHLVNNRDFSLEYGDDTSE